MFEIHLGIPEMEKLWNNLQKKHQDGTATKKEEKLRKQMGKVRRFGNHIWKMILRRQAASSGAMVLERAISQLLDLNHTRKINPADTKR